MCGSDGWLLWWMGGGVRRDGDGWWGEKGWWMGGGVRRDGEWVVG